MNEPQALFRASLGTLLLTIAHHARGAVLYESPFRLHVVFVAVPVAVALGVAYRGRSSPAAGGVARAAFLALSFFVGAAIGVYEGGYNHVLANLLYFTGAPPELFERIYPTVSEVPNDFWFEASGVLQFPPGAYAAWLAFRLAWNRPSPAPRETPRTTGS
jgi:hypothetical protein